MMRSWIAINGDRPARSLELLLHLCDRLSRQELVILRKVTEISGLRAAIVQSWVGVIKGYDCGDLLGQCNRHVERVGTSQREADEGEFATSSCQMCRCMLAQNLQCP